MCSTFVMSTERAAAEKNCILRIPGISPSWPYDDIVEASERRMENLLRENFTFFFFSQQEEKYYDNFMGCFICERDVLDELNHVSASQQLFFAAAAASTLK